MPILRMGNLQDGVIDAGNIKHVELSSRKSAKHPLARRRRSFQSYEQLGAAQKAANVSRDLPGEWARSYLVRLVVDEERALPLNT